MLSAVCWAATGGVMAMVATNAAPMPKAFADRRPSAWTADRPDARCARRTFV
jgi:hypothetical protein